MDSSDGSIDPESEVRKLQLLVKKLEKQNEVLRTKQDVRKSYSNSIPNENNGGNIDDSFSDTLNSRKSVALDDLEDVDLSALSHDEDSW